MREVWVSLHTKALAAARLASKVTAPVCALFASVVTVAWLSFTDSDTCDCTGRMYEDRNRVSEIACRTGEWNPGARQYCTCFLFRHSIAELSSNSNSTYFIACCNHNN